MRFTGALSALAIAALVVVAPHAAEARPRPSRMAVSNFSANKTFGLGLILGAPTGLSGKYFLTGDTALDFGLGFVGSYRRGGTGLHLHGDFLWHPVNLAETEPFYLPLYFGVGARFFDFNDCYYDNRGNHICYDDVAAIGVRAPIGVAFDFNNIPLDAFVELALVLDFFVSDYYGDDIAVDLNAAIGARYWFE